MAPAPEPACPLCLGSAAVREAVLGRRFYACGTCRLVFVHPADRPDEAAEHAHYATHENAADDPGYRRWLHRLAEPLAERLAPGAEGLDFGCGPAPVLAAMLTERGFPTAVYDPLFAPDREALAGTYAFVTCTETAEHFHGPRAEFERLDALLRPGGVLGVMTQLVRDDTRLADWRYARDPTHVALYAEETLAWIGRWRGWSLERVGRDVAFFFKP